MLFRNCRSRVVSHLFGSTNLSVVVWPADPVTAYKKVFNKLLTELRTSCAVIRSKSGGFGLHSFTSNLEGEQVRGFFFFYMS